MYGLDLGAVPSAKSWPLLAPRVRNRPRDYGNPAIANRVLAPLTTLPITEQPVELLLLTSLSPALCSWLSTGAVFPVILPPQSNSGVLSQTS